MRNSTSWARITALAASLAIITAGLTAGSAFAQEAPSATLEQASSGEDGTSGSGANSGNTSTGNAERDRDGNGGNASAGDAGEGGTTDTGTSEGAPLPENAETLEALGILDIVIAYDLTVLSGLEIPISLLPPPAEPVAAAPSDIDTGGQAPSGVVSGDATISETSTTSSEPASGDAPATGSSGTTAADGIGATDSGERERDRPRNDDAGSGYEAPGG
jgi:hypothetical protein